MIASAALSTPFILQSLWWSDVKKVDMAQANRNAAKTQIADVAAIPVVFDAAACLRAIASRVALATIGPLPQPMKHLDLCASEIKNAVCAAVENAGGIALLAAAIACGPLTMNVPADPLQVTDQTAAELADEA